MTDQPRERPRTGWYPQLSWRSPIIVAAGFAMLLASTQATWAREGNGSTLSGMDLADSLIDGPMSSHIGGWGKVAAAAIYASALGGCVVVGTSAFNRRGCALARLLVAALLVAAAIVVTAGGWFAPDRWGVAPAVTLAAAVAVAVMSVSELWYGHVARSDRSG